MFHLDPVEDLEGRYLKRLSVKYFLLNPKPKSPAPLNPQPESPKPLTLNP